MYLITSLLTDLMPLEMGIFEEQTDRQLIAFRNQTCFLDLNPKMIPVSKDFFVIKKGELAIYDVTEVLPIVICSALTATQ